MFAATFYVDQVVKDAKLAVPAGLSTACAADVCPDRAESQHARRSTAWLAANLRGLQRLYRGGADAAGSGKGFSRLLQQAGAAALDAELDAAIEAARAAFAAEPRDIPTLVVQDPAAAQALHEKVKAVTDLWKSQLVATLNLSVPDEGAGDND